MTKKGKTILITGAAGYVGAMLCEQFSMREDIDTILALDMEDKPDMLRHNKKVVWIQANTEDKGEWEPVVDRYKNELSVVVHAAWQIRELYGKQEIGWRWNIDGSRNIFKYALSAPHVERLVHFSSASVYGAFRTNTFEHLFSEDEPMREEEYCYGFEKRRSEEILKDMVQEVRARGVRCPEVSIVRPAAITGPRGRFGRIRFGLQSALAGKLSGNVFYRAVSLLVARIPATKGWVRQYIHEDDVTDIIALLALGERTAHEYEVFNITPPGELVYPEQMAAYTGKKFFLLPPFLVRIAFFIFWHGSRGIIPNGKGVWRFYSYPIVMDGSKLIRMYGYKYQYDSRSAFRLTTGRYEMVVPDDERVTQ